MEYEEYISGSDMLVSKIGGENSCDLAGNFQAVQNFQGGRLALAISALRSETFNTTTNLIDCAKNLQNGNTHEAFDKLQAIEDWTINQLRQSAPEHEELQTLVAETINDLRSRISQTLEIANNGSDYLATNSDGETFSITSYGELIARRIYARYFALNGLDVEELELNSLEDFNKTLNSTNAQIILTGGYAEELGDIRGYTDAKAAHMARVFDSLGLQTRLRVEKASALLTADPRGRLIENPRLISEVDPQTGAIIFEHTGVVQRTVMGILKDTNVEIEIYSPTTRQSTRVCTSANPTEGFRLLHKGPEGQLYLIGSGLDQQRFRDQVLTILEGNGHIQTSDDNIMEIHANNIPPVAERLHDLIIA